MPRSDLAIRPPGPRQSPSIELLSTEFPGVHRLARWQVRSATGLLASVQLDPVATIGAVGYGGTIDVPHYEARHIIILLLNGSPLVFVDGPRDSPHRYAESALCMWDPNDPANLRWTAEDGIIDLLYRVRNHLFREAWWRERHEWLGPEAPHGGVA